MTFKEFVCWCNARACDACWGFQTVRVCTGVMEIVRAVPRWRREKVWQKINRTFGIVEGYVRPTNAAIKRLLEEE